MLLSPILCLSSIPFLKEEKKIVLLSGHSQWFLFLFQPAYPFLTHLCFLFSTMLSRQWISFFSNTIFFFFLFPVLFNYVLFEKLVSAKLEKKSGRLWPFFFPQPLDNLVTASLSLTPLLVVNQILISQVTSVSRARACLSVDIPVPSSKFPSRQPSRPHLSLANLLRAIFCSPRILSKHQTLSLLPCLQFSVQLIS